MSSSPCGTPPAPKVLFHGRNSDSGQSTSEKELAITEPEPDGMQGRTSNGPASTESVEMMDAKISQHGI